KYPIVITATCYTAAFDTPADVESIGMKLVNKKDGGAIAVIGTPHRSMLMYDLQFMRTIIKYLADRNCKTLGDAFVSAKQEIKFREILEPVTLLGDPSLDITFLQQTAGE
ncbi:MAG: C25 family cysteine peptidase, partial [Candidatus Sumerlaeia bacterium]|nr:C25 family cysteine peptidase [Candidatus Sumerlaeia bacterium]